MEIIVAAVVDPVEPAKVLHHLGDYELKFILTTHHHWDHSGGNEEMFKKFPSITVCGGGPKIPCLNKKMEHEMEFSLGNISIKALSTFCHTQDHTCYLASDGNGQVVFTGDTLFLGGCGRFFEGNAQEMHHSLCNVLGSLKDSTLVYPGHEYTLSNWKFALSVDKENSKLVQQYEELAADHAKNSKIITVPGTIGVEKETNPFMRVDQKFVRDLTKSDDPVANMAFLRELKNNF